jgi:hypothetical protein
MPAFWAIASDADSNFSATLIRVIDLKAELRTVWRNNTHLQYR